MVQVLAVNQDPLGVQGSLVNSGGDDASPCGACETYIKPLHDGSFAVVLLNKGEVQRPSPPQALVGASRSLSAMPSGTTFGQLAAPAIRCVASSVPRSVTSGLGRTWGFTATGSLTLQSSHTARRCCALRRCSGGHRLLLRPHLRWGRATLSRLM